MDSVLSLFDRVDLKEESYVWVFDRIVVGIRISISHIADRQLSRSVKQRIAGVLCQIDRKIIGHILFLGITVDDHALCHGQGGRRQF